MADEDRKGFRKGFLGYRREQVEEMLEAREQRVVQLERDVLYLNEALQARERELRRMQHEVGEARTRTQDSVRSLAVVGDQLGAVREQALEEAARIRVAAADEAAATIDRLRALEGSRQETVRVVRAAAAELERKLEEGGDAASVDEVIERAGVDSEGGVIDGQLAERHLAEEFGTAPGVGELAEVLRAVQEAADAFDRISAGVGEETAGEGDAGASGNAPGAELFEGRVRIEVGPLGDFAQLSKFEDAAAEVAASSDVSIERFSEGRATLAVELAEPVNLVQELARVSPLPFEVRARQGDHVVLDVAA